MNPYFPFQALGFKCNPFRALTDDEWGELTVLPAVFAQSLPQLRYGQLLGDLGSGKTTWLMGAKFFWRQQGARVAYEYLPMGTQNFQTNLKECEVFLLDEAQRLSARERQRLLRALPNLPHLKILLASHEDLTSLWGQYGWPLITWQIAALPLAHLRQVLERRLSYFAYDTPLVTFADEAFDFLHTTFRADLRTQERFLYEVFQELKTPMCLTADYLRARYLGEAASGG